MKIWLDTQISPGLAAWINEKIEYKAHSMRALGLRKLKAGDSIVEIY